MIAANNSKRRMRGCRAACLLAFLAFLPRIAAAHGTVFFEANPDYASRFNLASVQAPTQIIMPPGDFWGGVDLWFDNEGPSGTATVELRRGDGTFIASVAANVPRRARVWGGSRLHIDFPFQVAITPSEPYQLTVESTLTDLFFYYFPRNQLLEHSSQYYPGAYGEPYLGPLRFGVTEQEFKLKLALTELREEAPPEVRNVAARLISPTEVAFAFNANESVDFRADLAPEGGTSFQTEFQGTYRFCPAESPPCALAVPVFPDTNYAFELFVKDQWENTSTARGSFRSLPAPSSPSPTPPPSGTPPAPGGTPAQTSAPTPGPDRMPPLILNARAIVISSERIQIAWQTNEAADSRLTLMAGTASLGTVSDATRELEHLLFLSGAFSPGQSYEAVIASRDPSGNEATERLAVRIPERTPQASGSPISAPASAEPPLLPSPAAFTPSSYTAAVQASQNEGMLAVRWNPPDSGMPPHGYRVDVFDESLRLVGTQNVPRGTNEASLPIGQHTGYRVIVYGNTNGAFEKIGAPITVQPEGGTRAPVGRGMFLVVFLALTAIPLLVLIRKFARS